MNTNLPNRFILIDDDLHTNWLFKFAVKIAAGNSDVKTFTDAESALEFIDFRYNCLNEHAKTILLLDINMPGTNGWEFLETFNLYSNEYKKHFSIYILSSSLSEVDMARANRHPLVREYLIKPLIKETVVRIIAQEQMENNLAAV